MKITWLGQAGLLFQKENFTILVDPYLSNSCAKSNPNSYRRIPIDNTFLTIKPDMILCTHNHPDHLDPETLQHYLTKDTKVTCLCSENGFHELRKFGGKHNYVMMHPGTVWSQNGLVITAISADHSETSALGFVITDQKKNYYITGDTLYNQNIFEQLPKKIDAVFLPINGVGNNMNTWDASKFAERIKPHKAVPLHWGLFDNLNPEAFAYTNRVIPKVYEEIKL